MDKPDIPTGPDPASILSGHQPDKVNMSAILMFGFVLVMVSVATFAVVAFMMGRFKRIDASRDANLSPVFSSVEGLYPEPRLQESPPRDMRAYNEEVARKRNSYGWVDRKAEIAHIPVDRAMELALQRKIFLKREESSASSTESTSDETAPKADVAEPSAAAPIPDAQH